MNYSELLTAAKAYSDRYDDETDSVFPTFFVMVESRINRLLKTREQSTHAYTPIQQDLEYYSLPPDWAGMRDIQLNNDTPARFGHSSQSFKYLDPKTFEIRRNQPPAGDLFYTVIGNQIQIYPTQDAGYTISMVYFQKVPPIGPVDDEFTVTTNWMSESHPDIYLAGLCGEISLFAKDYSAADGWFNKLELLVGELDNVDWNERWSGDALQIRVG